MPDIRLRPFRADDTKLLEIYGAQEWIRPYFEALASEAETGNAVSVFCGPDFLGCAGCSEVHPLRAVAWAIFVPGFPRHFLGIHRRTCAFLTQALETYARIEAYIDPEFPEAVRWVKLLGFREECGRKPYFFPDGRAGAEWVLIRGE